MNDKSALLEQLRLHRSVAEAEKPASTMKWIAGGAAALALLAAGVWFFLGRPSGVPVRIAVAQESRVVDEHHPALTERGLGMDELLCAQLQAVEHAMHPG